MGKMNPYADRHERDVAELFGLRRVSGSGSGDERGDATKDRDGSYWRLNAEAKSTQQKGFRITQDLWEEVRNRAYEKSSEMRPALAVRFYGPQDAKYAEILHDLIVMDIDDVAELLEEREQLAAEVERLKRGTDI